MLFDEGETIHGHWQLEDFTHPHPDMVTLISDPHSEESVNDKHTFQVRDYLYEEDLPKPHIQYTPHQIKNLQMKDTSPALKINKLQKGTQPQKPLPNTYFLNRDGVLYCCVREGCKRRFPSSVKETLPIGTHYMPWFNGTQCNCVGT